MNLQQLQTWEAEVKYLQDRINKLKKQVDRGSSYFNLSDDEVNDIACKCGIDARGDEAICFYEEIIKRIFK